MRAQRRRSGCDIIEDCEVTGVRIAANAATGVETSRGYVAAERIVFATAGHTGMIGAMLGVPLPIETHLLQAMVTEPIKPLLHTVLVYVSPGHGEVYIAQSDRGGLVMGGHLDGFPSYTREGHWDRLEDVAQGAVELLPQIGGIRILRQWAGTNDMTMDGSPIIDRLRYDNVFVNAGWCYGGFKAIPASGAACAAFVATGTRAGSDQGLSRCRASRPATCSMSAAAARSRCGSDAPGLPVLRPARTARVRVPQDAAGGPGQRVRADLRACRSSRAFSVEHWQHVEGCRGWLKVERNPSTGAVLATRLLGGSPADGAS